MRVWGLSPAGYARIASLQDKYRFQTTYAVEDLDGAQAFVDELLQCVTLGLDVDEEDRQWLEEAQDRLGCEVEDNGDFVEEEINV